MGRPRLKEKDKKVRLGITISRELNELLDTETTNKSSFIEILLKYFFKNKKNEKNNA